jgi:hypothetical protein
MANPEYTAGETLAQGDACYIGSNSRMYKALSSNSVKMPVIAIAAESLATAATGEFYPYGKITWGTWSEPNKPLYISGTTSGLITETAPTAYATHQAIGITLSTTVFMFWDTSAYSSVAKSLIWKDSSIVARRRGINFISGSNMTITTSDNSTYDRVDVTLASSGSGGSGLSSYYDVVAAYGADPTGVADSTTNIQNAINTASGAGGGVVWFPKGTYKTTTKLVMASNVNLKGAGIGVSKIYCTGNTSPHYYAAYLISVDNITIDGISFYSTNDGAATLYGIWMEGCSNINITNCELYYFYNYGIRPHHYVNTNINISNNYLHHIHSMASPNPANDGTAIVAGYLKNSKIVDNYITACGCAQNVDHGIYAGATTDNLLIKGNILYANVGGNIQVDDYTTSYQASNISIIGNQIINGSYFGIVVHRLTGGVVSDNVVLMSGSGSEPAIDLYYKYNNDIIVSNNVVRSTITRPLIGLSGNRIICVGNMLYGNGNASSIGVTVGRDSAAGGYVNDIKVLNNSIANVQIGILGSELARRLQIIGNTVETATKGSSVVNGADYVLHRGNIYYGVTENWNADSGYGSPSHLTNDTSVDW